jgi:ATP-binding cassette subfamily B protein
VAGVLNLPKDWHDAHQSGDTIDKIEKGTSGLYSFASNSFWIIYTAVKLAVSVALLAYFFPPSAAIVGAALALATWIVARIDRDIVALYRTYNRAENAVQAGLVDAIGNIATVIILRAERLIHGAQVRRSEEPYPAYMRLTVLNEIKWGLTSLIASATVVIVMGAYLWSRLGVAGTVLVGNVYLLYRYLTNFTDVIERVTAAYSDVIVERARVANAEELGDQFVGESLTDHVLPADWRAIRVKGLTFSYNGSGRQLDGVSLTLRRGERRAIVGQSGGGKTTLLMVARGLYRGASLDLTVDGAPIPQGFDGIARDIALVPQKTEVFAGTIRENITMGADCAEADIRWAIEAARFAEVVDALPKGLDSSVNEDGVNLSGGQRQRLALARALLVARDKAILLLDEPTSALDPKTSADVVAGVLGACPDATIVATVHQLELLPLFDRVSVFEKGRLVGEGTPEELRATCAAFRELERHPERAISPA